MPVPIEERPAPGGGVPTAFAAKLHAFAPVIDERVEVVVLGSFPGAASLAAGQYYAHPRNAFWSIMGYVLAAPLLDLSYPQRLACLLDHRVGLWDAVARCERRGSLDVNIRRAEPADLSRLLAGAPRLRAVAFNGRMAGRVAPTIAARGYETAVLPSTSPTHAGLRVEYKRATWQNWFAAVLPAVAGAR